MQQQLTIENHSSQPVQFKGFKSAFTQDEPPRREKRIAKQGPTETEQPAQSQRSSVASGQTQPAHQEEQEKWITRTETSTRPPVTFKRFSGDRPDRSKAELTTTHAQQRRTHPFGTEGLQWVTENPAQPKPKLKRRQMTAASTQESVPMAPVIAESTNDTRRSQRAPAPSSSSMAEPAYTASSPQSSRQRSTVLPMEPSAPTASQPTASAGSKPTEATAAAATAPGTERRTLPTEQNASSTTANDDVSDNDSDGQGYKQWVERQHGRVDWGTSLAK
jgi:hypothetical protein